MEIQKLADWNPWWENQKVPEELFGKERPSYSALLDSSEVREVTIITGVRRSGKSTLMYQMISQLLQHEVLPKQILFVNLEDPRLISDSIDDIYATYRSQINPDQKAYFFFDEIQRKGGWEAWIRKKYDLKTHDKFVLSGSCSYLLKKEYATLLTGRNLTFEVFPLSFDEFLVFKGIPIDKQNIAKGIVSEKTKHILLNNLHHYLSEGGFPEVAMKQEQYRMRLLAQYFDDILYKDIVARYGLNSQKAKDFALYLMTNIANPLSLRSLRNALQLSYDTIKDYLSCYKEAFLFFTTDHFSYSFKEQKTLPSKLYCIDTGLRQAVSFAFSKDEGRLAENLVFLALRRQEKEPYYWKNKGEIDFLVKEKDTSLTAINISYTNSIESRELIAFDDLKKKFSKTKHCIVLTKDIQEKKQGVQLMPLWKWLLENT